MELLRKAVGDNWSKPDGYDTKNMTRAVSEEEWKIMDEKFNDMSGGFMLIETSKEDMAKVEDLLQVKRGFFGTSAMIKTIERYCRKCGRENNFLDVVTTGLRVHKPEFVADVLSGKHGPILNTHQTQRCFCYECGEELPQQAAKYSSPKVVRDGISVSGYTWNWPF
ncbi:unnamed protein product [Rotaria sp. Silwood2]|nr:unnamed protein product [Rotaria sp. Silwood2]CAF4546518.1 unnamed protein product [Rotaria sp. Silwood2]